MAKEKRNLYPRLGTLTVFAVFLLILVGGIVRSTGSGMGCPDWPKCFGSWVPPTEVSQLPSNYKEIYAEKRRSKNQKLGKILIGLGWSDLAHNIQNDPKMYIEADFNATKTWIEYVNRLIGVVIGFLILGTLVASFSYWKKDRLIFWLSLATFLLVGFQGWIGSLVVSTNLLPGMITLHMVLAVLIVLLLIYAVMRSWQMEINFQTVTNKATLNVVIISIFILSFIQLLFGTELREEVDRISQEMPNQRNLWLETIGFIFYRHRTFSWLILLNTVVLYFFMFRKEQNTVLRNLSLGIILIVFAEFLIGVGMSYFAIPYFLQPFHLLLASLLLGWIFTAFLVINADKVFSKKHIHHTKQLQKAE